MKIIRSTIYLSLLFSLVSCGEQRKGSGMHTPSPGEVFSSEIKTLDANSWSIAYRVCNAFRSKRTYWHMTPIIGKTAKLDIKERECSSSSVDESTIDSKISAPTLSSPITFASLSTENYEKNIQTDAHGYLAQVCPTIISGENPIQFYSIKRDERIYTQFQNIDASSDAVHVKFTKEIQDKNGDIVGYESYRVVSLKISTSGVSDMLLGTVSELKDSKKCEDGADEYIEQTLASIL